MLQGFTSGKKDLSLSVETIDFGFTEKGRLSEAKQLTLTNKLSFPVKVEWALLPVLDKATGKVVRNPFNVVPAELEIEANSTGVFNVDFAPYEPDSYFFQVAQCFVHLLNGGQFKTKKLCQTSS